MEAQNEENQEQSNATKIYFFYCPDKDIEKNYNLSFLFFSEEKLHSEFLEKYEKFDVKLNDGNFNIYIISIEINNNLNKYEYFNILNLYFIFIFLVIII